MSEPATYRPDIDGLRAVAIIAVVGFHIGAPGFSGGYVGVDVFFVISGFLITGLLVREQDRAGRIDFADFYARRVRRLVPALGLVLAAVLALGLALLLPTGEQQDLATSAMAVAGFVSNFYFKAVQSDYFGTRAAGLPLLHTWTLAVEEQFYLVWPPALAITAWLARRLRWNRRRLLAALVAVGGAASLAACAALTWKWPQWTFFVTPFRAWEFAAGALIALAPPGGGEGRARGSWLFLAGLAAIVAATVGFDAQTLFPGLAALLPVAGAAAVIAGGSAAPAGPAARLLGSPPMVAIGKVSYSWYLWHWPLLAVWSLVTLKSPGLAAGLMLALLALLLAALTWRFVEQPVRGRRPGPFATPAGALVAGAAILAACAALAGGLRVWADHDLAARPRSAAAAEAMRGRVKRLAGCEQPSTFRDLPPASLCRRGAPPPATTVMLWGDSHARHLEPVLTARARADGRAVLYRVKGGCRPRLAAPARIDDARGFRAMECLAFSRAVLDSLADARAAGIEGVVISARWEGQGDRMREDLAEIVARLRARGLRVLLLADAPQFPFDAPACVARRGWTACDLDRAAVDAGRADEVGVLRSLAAHDPGVAFWDPAETLCGPRVCSPVRDGAILYGDAGHLSRAGALALDPDIRPALDWVAGRTDARP
ncbi:MAG: acyltransferase family protein [Pseudomonadota bacterium]